MVSDWNHSLVCWCRSRTKYQPECLTASYDDDLVDVLIEKNILFFFYPLLDLIMEEICISTSWIRDCCDTTAK
jgi:hypothetical protein